MKTDIIKKQNEIIKAILEITKIHQIYIFGSYARGEQNEDSDIDFYIIINNKIMSFEQMKEITYKIRKNLLEKNLYTRMDILINDFEDFENKKNTNGSIENIVISEGVLIYG